MIKDSIDFDYAINKIVTDTIPEIIHQNDVLDSKNMNSTFKSIEDNLNLLYEKTRYLEDAIAYAKEFLIRKDKEFKDEMESIILELDKLIDNTKNLAYLTLNVPLSQNETSGKLYDRDGSVMSPLFKKDKQLHLNHATNNNYDISSVSSKSDSIAYDSTINNAAKSKTYRAVFLEEQIVHKGLTEELTIRFKTPQKVNFLNFTLSNCKIKNIRFGLLNGLEENIGDYDSINSNAIHFCTYIKFDVVCTNYTAITYEVEKARLTKDSWNELKDFENAKMSSVDKVSKLNLDYIISRTTNAQKEYFVDARNKDLVSMDMYSYIFSIDKMEFGLIEYKSEGCFISDRIQVGKMTTMEYLNLCVEDFRIEGTSIEYSILDGDVEIPMIPLNVDLIEDEWILTNKDTRFGRDYNTTSDKYVEEVVKKDGQIVNMSYEDAKTMSDGKYSLTYRPGSLNYAYTPINNDIRIKCYIRYFGPTPERMPYIKSISIRKYGEDTLWTSKY